ncbi:MAG: TIR domain-containing protein [Calditrichia bacterium]
MNAQLRRRISSILTQQFNDDKKRRTICTTAFSDHPNLLGMIDFSGPPMDFSSHLISVLNNYGRLDSGRSALEELLRTIQDMVGSEKKNEIDEIVSQINTKAEFKESKQLDSKVRILVLSANPRDSMRLRIGEEVREISEGLKRSKHRERFELTSQWAVRPVDLRRALLDFEPTIIHFSGHGTDGEESGIFLEDNNGLSKLVQTEALANLIGILSDQVDCVVLNSCYSILQAKAVVEHISYVIGMKDAIADRAAILFSTAFYDGLGGGMDIPKAFALAKNAIELEGISGKDLPILLDKESSELKNELHRQTPKAVRPKDLHETDQPASAAPAGGRKVTIIASPSDDAAAREMYRELKSRGYSPWYQPIDLLPGQSIQPTVRKNIREADYSIVFFSRQALSARGEIHRNYRSALDALQERPEGDIFLIPVKLGDCEIPFGFESYNYVDYRNKAVAIEKIFKALGAG